LAPGTVTDGLQRLEVLLRPISEAIKQRNPHGDLHLADETRWRVFVVLEGKQGHGWWLWVLSRSDTVAYVLDADRSHAVPEGHYRAQSRGVLVVDRYAAYKAMIWVKDGVIVLAFCWSHVRRDFVRVGKGWPELKTWALQWLRRIRLLFQRNHRRLAGFLLPSPGRAGSRDFRALRARASSYKQRPGSLIDPEVPQNQRRTFSKPFR
jgi:hypothetical protein